MRDYCSGVLINPTYDSSTGVLTLTGPALPVRFQEVLRTVTYNNTSDTPDEDIRFIDFVVSDGQANSAPATSTVMVDAANDAPVITAGGTLTYDAAVASAPATAIDNTVTVTDVDSVELVGATVQITNNPVPGEEVLDFTDTATIKKVTYDAVTGLLTLKGTDTLANYQVALRTVRYQNTSGNALSAARTVEFEVNDGSPTNNLSKKAASTITP